MSSLDQSMLEALKPNEPCYSFAEVEVDDKIPTMLPMLV